MFTCDLLTKNEFTDWLKINNLFIWLKAIMLQWNVNSLISDNSYKVFKLIKYLRFLIDLQNLIQPSIFSVKKLLF